MPNNIEWLLEARAEFDAAWQWYAERDRTAALGFIAAVDEALAKIAANPKRFPLVWAGGCRCLLHRYPYSLIFDYDETRVTIVAVAHAKRHPGYWRQRL